MPQPSDERAIESLEFFDLVDSENLPTHDQLFIEAKKAQDAGQGEEGEEASDSPVADPEDDETGAEAPEDEDVGSDPAAAADGSDTEPADDGDQEVAQDDLRKDDGLVNAMESFGAEDGLMVRGARLLGSAAVEVSSFAWSVFKTLAIIAKDLGIQYGPKVYKMIKVSVALVINKSAKSLFKFISSNADARKLKKVSFQKSLEKAKKLQAACAGLKEAGAKLTMTDPFRHPDYYSLFLSPIDGKARIKPSIESVGRLIGVVRDVIEPGVEMDIRTIEHVIESAKHGTYINIAKYLTPPISLNSLAKADNTGFNTNPDILSTYVSKDIFPKNTLLVYGLPNESMVEEANKTNDVGVLSKAYHASFLMLAPNPVTPKSIPMVNYVDLEGLETVLDSVVKLCESGIAMTEGYRRNIQRAERLKRGYRTYFDWLVSGEDQRSLKESYAELIYLKQSFITRVYQAAMIDIHDFSATYLREVLGFVEDNMSKVKVGLPDEESGE